MPNGREKPHTTPARPDTRDWTFVLTEPCPECGFTPGQPVARAGTRLRDAAPRWHTVLARPRVTTRPEPDVWSPLEYACHVLELSRVFAGRVEQMRTQDDPTFSNWDGERAAVVRDYNAQDAQVVASEIGDVLGSAADMFDQLVDTEWQRPGTRGDGRRFSIATLADYWLHEVQHHLADVDG
ncbi:MAG: DinB family protein [Brooklawnia sp.]|nr:DinB family protein [Brooklawnia sp.]